MLAQNLAALMFEFTFQVRRDGCMSESKTTCVVRGGSVMSVVAVIGVSGVVGVEFWPSLCTEALLLWSLLGCIVAFLLRKCLAF
jgi:hypothetical protein